ncbi:hypothetical protein EKH55_1474 [Sinorhizobium alkalisoli]|nr:hypothetical protein EKH55_1474 [Sinorhizobium alkalisoli]
MRPVEGERWLQHHRYGRQQQATPCLNFHRSIKEIDRIARKPKPLLDSTRHARM